MKPDHQAWLNQTRLAARRGNLETELLLLAYIERVIAPHPDPKQHALFSQLLDENDQTLFDWLLHPTQSPPLFHALIQQIRENYLNSTD